MQRPSQKFRRSSVLLFWQVYIAEDRRLEPLEALWSARSVRPIFTAVTSLKRFKSLLRYLSFDNKATRETRRATDKLAAVILQWLQRSIKLRRQFLTSLGQQLVDDHIQQRLLNRRSIRKDARLALKLLGYIDSPADMEAVEQPPAKRCCVLCPRSRDRKVRKMCTVCNRNVCKDHITPGFLCEDCL